MKRSKIGPLLGIGRGPHPAALACMIAVIAAVPRASHAADAECGVSDSGIPDGVIIPIDVAHMRKSLADIGLGISGIYTGEVFANTGGLKQGAAYDGVLELDLNGNLKKMGLWKGLCFHASSFQIHGNRITANTGSLMPVSNLEATPATRLFELWVEQHLFDDKLEVRIGQLAAARSSFFPTAILTFSMALGAGPQSPPQICQAAGL